MEENKNTTGVIVILNTVAAVAAAAIRVVVIRKVGTLLSDYYRINFLTTFTMMTLTILPVMTMTRIRTAKSMFRIIIALRIIKMKRQV